MSDAKPVMSLSPSRRQNSEETAANSNLDNAGSVRPSDSKNSAAASMSFRREKRAFPYHAHSLMEEMYIVLDGSGTLRQDGQEYPIRPGDVIASPIGKAHQIVNTSENDLRYLVISNNDPVDVVLYPDSGKIGAISKAFGKTLWHLTRQSAATDYYDGEE